MREALGGFGRQLGRARGARVDVVAANLNLVMGCTRDGRALGRCRGYHGRLVHGRRLVVGRSSR